MPVRLGAPQDIAGLNDIVRNPIYSTGVGLLQYGMLEQKKQGGRASRTSPGFFARIKQWFQGNF